MARTVPSSYTAPDPGLYIPEEVIGEATSTGKPEALAMAGQYLAALHRPTIHQCWHPTDDICRRTATMPARPAAGSYGTSVAIWRVPPYANRTGLVCAADCLRSGATGTVRFRGVAADSISDLTAGAARAWVVGGGVTLDFTAGYDDVEMYIAGTGAADTHVYAAYGEFATMSSPMSAPAASDGYVPFDADELDDDEPLSADAMARLSGNMTELKSRVQVFYIWSRIANTSAGGAAPATMPAYTHRFPVSVNRGTTRRQRKVTVWVRSINAGGSDQYVRILAGGSRADMSDGRVVGTITVPAGTAALDWFTADVAVPEEYAFRGAGLDHPWCNFGIVANSYVPTRGSDAAVYSVSAWGL